MMNEVNVNDVLLGRGRGIQAHPGNKQFRALVDSNKELFAQAQRRREKRAIAMNIIDVISCLDPPGRFLVQNKYGEWTPVDKVKAFDKTLHRLREKGTNGVSKGCIKNKLRLKHNDGTSVNVDNDKNQPERASSEVARSDSCTISNNALKDGHQDEWDLVLHRICEVGEEEIGDPDCWEPSALPSLPDEPQSGWQRTVSSDSSALSHNTEKDGHQDEWDFALNQICEVDEEIGDADCWDPPLVFPSLAALAPAGPAFGPAPAASAGPAAAFGAPAWANPGAWDGPTPPRPPQPKGKGMVSLAWCGNAPAVPPPPPASRPRGFYAPPAA